MSGPFDATRFRQHVAEDIAVAAQLVAEIEQLAYWTTDDNPDEQEALARHSLRRTLRRIASRLEVAFELNEMPLAVTGVRESVARFTELADVMMLPYADVLASPALDYLSDVYEALSGCLPGEEETTAELGRGRSLLAQILAGTAALITNRKLVPSNEAEVKREVYGLLLHTFPDTVRELPIPHGSKTYRADIGVKSLKAAIEYKFADTKEELKTSFEGIYADTKGYAGSNDWTYFFAVIYCTQAFWTPAQVEAECTGVGMPSNWQVMVMTGSGQRRTKA